MIRRDLIIYCNRASDGARTLARALGARYIREGARTRNTEGSLVINWGCASAPSWRNSGIGKQIVVNSDDSVNLARSKVASFTIFNHNGVPTLEWTKLNHVAKEWHDNDAVVFNRKDYLSSGGGIKIIKPDDPWDTSLTGFYTKYFKKDAEFRVHVFNGKVIDITRKKRTSAVKENDRSIYEKMVRSLDNGWIHAHEDIGLSSDALAYVGSVACRAVQAVGLLFGACDILFRFSTSGIGKALVAEVNSAPGVVNTKTLDAYVKAILELYSNTRQERKVPTFVRKLVNVTFRTRKGNLVTRQRYRKVKGYI